MMRCYTERLCPAQGMHAVEWQAKSLQAASCNSSLRKIFQLCSRIFHSFK